MSHYFADIIPSSTEAENCTYQHLTNKLDQINVAKLVFYSEVLFLN